jgi:hypothetical protein
VINVVLFIDKQKSHRMSGGFLVYQQAGSGAHQAVLFFCHGFWYAACLISPGSIHKNSLPASGSAALPAWPPSRYKSAFRSVQG